MLLETGLDHVLARAKSENRAALIAYIPAGFPSHEGCKKVIAAFAAGVETDRRTFPEYAAVAGVLGVERAVAVAQADDERA